MPGRKISTTHSLVAIVIIACAISEDHTVSDDISGINDGVIAFIAIVCLLLVYSQTLILVVQGTICQGEDSELGTWKVATLPKLEIGRAHV